MWTAKLIPGKIRARFFDHKTGKDRELKWDYPDFKAKVVCKKCNETWMNDIENEHAQPTLTPLITGQVDIPLGLSEARSMALFSFKTAVVLDQANRTKPPFFDRSSRHNFRETLSIPAYVQMWLCAYTGHRGSGQFLTIYHQQAATNGWHMYVCTFAIGNLAIQVLAVKEMADNVLFRPTINFDPLAVPFWPGMQRNYVWPGTAAIRSADEFTNFAGRWQNIEVITR